MSNGTSPAPWYRTFTGWMAFTSLLISLAVAGFTGLQWQAAHEQLLLSVRPHVNFDTENDPDVPPVGIAITNAGPGPAIIKSVTYYIDRKPVRDWKEALEYGKINSDIVDYFDFEPDDTLAVGEKDWLIKYLKPRGQKVKQKDINDFADFVDQHVAIKVFFTSVREDVVWSKCSTKGYCD